MNDNSSQNIDIVRPEYSRVVSPPEVLMKVKIEYSFREKIWHIPAVRKATILILMAIIWQVYSLYLNNKLMLPSFTSSVSALVEAIGNGQLPQAIFTSMRVLLVAYFMGVVLAGIISTLALTCQLGADFLETCTGMFNMLPAIALLPLALLWFGLGYPSIIFVIVHSVTWPITINLYAGFTGVSKTLRMVGRNYELGVLAYLFKLLIPAALPHILTGLKVGWAFSWRTLIASELVFGVSSGSGGIGWFIYEKKNQLDIAMVFAGLITIIVIGVLVENLMFKVVENRTVRKWGMKS